MRLLIPLVIVLIACGSRAESPGPATSASTAVAASAAASQTASPTPSPAPSASPSPRPNPTAGPGTYASTTLGYRVDIPAGWRRSACQSTREVVTDAVETFTSASVDEESGTDTGPANDVVVLRVESSATGMTALQWLESGKMGFSSATHVEKATIDGKDGARIVPNDGSPSLAFVVAARGRMYALSAGIRDQAARPAVIALLSSFHVLSDAELADARATLATPTPAPARSAEAVAQTLETGFAQKEVAAIAPVTGDCVQQALEQAGASFMSSAKFFSDLRTRFANGLAVSVQAAQLVDQQADYAAVRGTWKDPGQPVRNVKLMLRRIGNAWYWDGVLYLQG